MKIDINIKTLSVEEKLELLHDIMVNLPYEISQVILDSFTQNAALI